MTADAFCAVLTGACGVKPGAHVLAAVSGGADSVALLLLLCDVRARLDLTIDCAHVEHGVRGADSLTDMAFVRALCEARAVPCHCLRADAPQYARDHRIGLEDACRRLRYDFLYSTARTIGADCIAVAHHAQDQAETVLLHLLRGSDIAGLCAMRMKSGALIRPLLNETPQALREMLNARGQSWREDATNENTDYTRNYLRHAVLPQLARVNPEAISALCRVSLAAQRDESYFAKRLDEADITPRRLVNGLALPLAEIRSMDDALRSRLLKRLISQAGLPAQSGEVIRQACLLTAEGARAVLNLEGCGRLEVGRRDVFITGRLPEMPDVALRMTGETATPWGTFSVRAALAGETGDGKRAQVIPQRVLSGAMISQRRSGERMTPFGAAQPVRVKKLLADASVEAAERPGIPALRAAEGEILWLPLVRAGQACERRGGEAAAFVTFRPGEK